MYWPRISLNGATRTRSFINNDPEEIGEALPHLFDVIVTDVPCSGEGMFRKDTDSTGEWSVDNVRLCASRGRRIIHDIWNA